MPAPSFIRPARLLAALWLAAASFGALAHDTWFAAEPSDDAGEVTLALGTGTRFPQLEFPIGMEQLRRHGCRRGDAAPVPLRALRDAPAALVVQADAGPAGSGAAVTCWAQLIPFEIQLAPEKIKLYLKEIRPPQAVLDAWAGMQARGLPWKERYTKHARIELVADAAGAAAEAPQPVAMDMDVLLESGLRPVHAGDPLVFRVLRDGAPLPDFSVELRGDRSRVGIWRKTDAEGRVRIPAPLPGHWVLRGTDLRLSDSRPDSWESRFVTLAFDIAP